MLYGGRAAPAHLQITESTAHIPSRRLFGLMLHPPSPSASHPKGTGTVKLIVLFSCPNRCTCPCGCRFSRIARNGSEDSHVIVACIAPHAAQRPFAGAAATEAVRPATAVHDADIRRLPRTVRRSTPLSKRRYSTSSALGKLDERTHECGCGSAAYR